MEYYLASVSAPTHWLTAPGLGLSPVAFTIADLSPSDTVFVVVRARNGRGLSPPSPVSKAMRTEANAAVDTSG